MLQVVDLAFSSSQEGYCHRKKGRVWVEVEGR